MSSPIVNAQQFIDHGKQLAGIEARECVVRWMIARGYATGHGDTIEDLLVELEGQAKRNGANEYRGDQRC